MSDRAQLILIALILLSVGVCATKGAIDVALWAFGKSDVQCVSN